MRRIVMLLLVLGVATMLVAAVQDTSSQSQSSQSQAQQPSNSQSTQQSQTDSQNNKQMTGKVSSDGKTFTNEKDSKSYTVDNPDSLKGHEGEPVALVVQMDPTTNTVHILTVTAPEQK